MHYIIVYLDTNYNYNLIFKVIFQPMLSFFIFCYRLLAYSFHQIPFHLRRTFYLIKPSEEHTSLNASMFQKSFLKWKMDTLAKTKL